LHLILITKQQKKFNFQILEANHPEKKEQKNKNESKRIKPVNLE
jgi:hypothetical protein